MGQGHDMVNFGYQEVNGQGHRTPKLNWDTSWRHRSWSPCVEWVFQLNPDSQLISPTCYPSLTFIRPHLRCDVGLKEWEYQPNCLCYSTVYHYNGAQWYKPYKLSNLHYITLHYNNNNNNNNHDNVYGAVIMAEPLREFTRFTWWM